MNILSPQGILYFSTNKRKFQISPEVNQLFMLKDISKDTIPIDFKDQHIHKCFQISHKS